MLVVYEHLVMVPRKDVDSVPAFAASILHE